MNADSRLDPEGEDLPGVPAMGVHTTVPTWQSHRLGEQQELRAAEAALLARVPVPNERMGTPVDKLVPATQQQAQEDLEASGS
jgi:hypothetical protein